MTGRRPAEALLALVDSDPNAVLGSDALMARLKSDSDLNPLAIALRARALAYAHLERLDLAVATIEQALELATDEDVVGGVEMTAGALMVWTGSTQRGLDLLRQAAHRPGVGSAAGVQLGASLYRLGRYSEALSALDGARSTLDPGETEWWSRLETNLGLTLAALGRTREAREAISRSMDLDRAAGHERGVATGYQNLGWVASVSGDLPAAFEYYEEAAARLQTSANAELWRDRADALLSAGFIDEAVAATASAVEALAASGHATAATEARLKLSQALLVKGDWAAARTAASAAAAEFQDQERPGWATYARSLAAGAEAAADPAALAAEALLDMADDLDRHGFASPAQDFRARAIISASRAGRAAEVDDVAQRLVAGSLRPQSAPAAWLARAEIHRSLGRRRQALQSVARGMAAVEEMSAALGGSEARAYASRSLDGLAGLALGLTRASGRPRRVFDWIERGRAGSLRLPRVTSSGDVVTTSLVSELRSLERTAVDLRPGPDLDDLFRQRARLEARIRHRTRALRGDGGHARAVRAAESLDSLGPGEAILELAVSGGAVFGILLHRGRAREVECGDESRAVVAQHRVLRSLARAARRPGGTQAAAVTSDIAAVPLDFRVPASVETLIVVPPPTLYAMPWSLLAPLHGVIVAVAPSTTASLAGKPAGPRVSATCVAGAGLVHGVSEAKRVAAIYPHSRVMGEGSVAESVLASLNGVDVGHIACHGSFRVDSPLFSSLDLAGGLLFFHELEQLSQPPATVVLSACDLGVSAAVSGSEALGPVSALIAAGVASVIASPVLVPDAEVVGDLFSVFHRELHRGTRPAAALATAKKTSLAEGHPLAPVMGALQCHGQW